MITLWENGYAMVRIYDEGAKVESLSQILLSKTDLSMVNNSANKLTNSTTAVIQDHNLIKDEIKENNTNVVELESIDNEQKKVWTKQGVILTKENFLSKFRYLKDENEFDW